MSLASQFFTYATLISAIVVVALAVARDVPILHLIAPPDTDFGDWSGLAVCLPLAVAMIFGPPWLGFAAWAALIVYFWRVAAGICGSGDNNCRRGSRPKRSPRRR